MPYSGNQSVTLIKSPRLTDQQMTTICYQLIDGKSLATICQTEDSVPGKRTVLRHIQENDDAYIGGTLSL